MEREEDHNVETETPQTVGVDIGGVSIELSQEDADKVLSWRNERKSQVSKLEEDLQAAQNTITDLNQKVKYTETNSEEKFNSFKTEVETSMKSEYEGKIKELESKLLDQSIMNLINSNDSIVQDESARQDLKNLFKGNIKDTENMKNEFEEFVKSKPYFMSVETDPARPPVRKSKVTPPTPQKSAGELLRDIIKI